MFKNIFWTLVLLLQTTYGGIQLSKNIAPETERPVADQKAINSQELVSYVDKIEEMGITLHPGTEFTKDSKPTAAGMNHCSALAYGTLKKMPEPIRQNLKNLTLYFSDSGRRGLGGGSTIILRCQNVSDQELVSVFVHELGHIMDTGVLAGNFWAGESEFRDGKNAIYNDDLSLDFYRISFKNDHKLADSAERLDFVSGYAMTDPFEDFAETYNYYWLHGDNFREMIKNNLALTEKYQFMKDNVFNGEEFNFNSEKDIDLLTERVYDSTLIAYDLEDFLVF